MAIKIKKVVVKELHWKNSVPPTVERDNYGTYFHSASESEHSLFAQVSFKALSKRTKSFMLRLPSDSFLTRVVFFILAGFCFQIKSNTILLTCVAKFFGVSITLEMNTSLQRADVLTIFILPYIDKSVRDQTLRGFSDQFLFLGHRPRFWKTVLGKKSVLGYRMYGR